MTDKKKDENVDKGGEGYRQSVELLRSCHTEYGFVATTTRKDNYNRIWGRDSCVMALAALLSGDTDLVEGARLSLETLAAHQGPHGEIPSNVDPDTGRVSLGGTAGRVDADLWFVIACGEYWKHTGDNAFIKEMLEPLEAVRFLLGAWEFNNRGLLFVPPTGDWADEYLQSGYVLYDQILYFLSLRTFSRIHADHHDTRDHLLEERVARLKHLIRANYWFSDDKEELPEDVYHENLYQKAARAANRCQGRYWMPFFSPVGYGYRFDALANILTGLAGLADKEQNEIVDTYIAEEIVNEDAMLLPAFSPVIRPKDEEWDDLQMTFSHTFKNQPDEYHNGGLWPFVTGFYVASLARRGKSELASRYRDGIDRANRKKMADEAWSFPEYLHGKKGTPGGTHPMGWSAAASVIAHETLAGKTLFN
ncbi:MAG: glycoside hydrolase 100 family protein [Oceanipulchritudo sp.]